MFPGVVHRGTEVSHRIYEICDRPLAHPGDPVDGVGSPAEGEHGRQETGNRASVANEEIYARSVDPTALAAYADFSLSPSALTSMPRRTSAFMSQYESSEKRGSGSWNVLPRGRR